MSFFRWLRSNRENGGNESPAEKPSDPPKNLEKKDEPSALPTPQTQEIPPLSPPNPEIFLVPLSLLADQFPTHLINRSKIHLNQTIGLPKEDLFIEEDTCSIPLSIVSISCPDIFEQPVSLEEDKPIRFSQSKAKELAARKPTIPQDPALEKNEQPPSTTKAAPSSSSDSSQPAAVSQPLEISIPVSAISKGLLMTSLGNKGADLEKTDEKINLPFELIAPQLSSGKVELSAQTFLKYLPESLKPAFANLKSGTKIDLPLSQIIENLPQETLKQRADQLPDTIHPVPTPFSSHAEEDAKRFNTPPETSDHKITTTVDSPLVKSTLPSPAPSTFAIPKAALEKLQFLLLTDVELNVTIILEHLSKLPGVSGAILGNREGELLGKSGQTVADPTQLAKVAPLIHQVLSSPLEKLQIPALEQVTLYTSKLSLTTFASSNLSLLVTHENRPFKPGVREKIAAVLEALDQEGVPSQTAATKN